MNRKATMQDIADRLGVTKVSVSKAMNNQPGISDRLREQILTVAKEIGYTRTRHTSENRSYSFALVCPKRFFLKGETFYTTIYYYINKRCSERGYSVSCFVINDKEELCEEVPTQLQNSSFDGIFISGEFQRGFLNKLEALDGAKIAIDFYHTDMTMDSIVVDNYYTGLQVTNYLIEKGHRKIGFVGNIHDTSSICDRYFGYLKALTLHDLPVRADWHIVNNDFIKGTYTTDFELPDELPTAFVCHCDTAAFTLMQRLEAAGIKMLDEVSLISFDNTSLCDLITPRLTSVNIDCKQIALHSLDQMLYRINHPDAMIQKIYLGSRLVERDSVADMTKSD